MKFLRNSWWELEKKRHGKRKQTVRFTIASQLRIDTSKNKLMFHKYLQQIKSLKALKKKRKAGRQHSYIIKATMKISEL